MAELKIVSFNTQGLGGIKKQKDVFDYLKIQNLIFLSTRYPFHFTADQECYIRN